MPNLHKAQSEQYKYKKRKFLDSQQQNSPEISCSVHLKLFPRFFSTLNRAKLVMGEDQLLYRKVTIGICSTSHQ